MTKDTPNKLEKEQVRGNTVTGFSTDPEDQVDDGLDLTGEWGEDLTTSVNLPIMEKRTITRRVERPNGKWEDVEEEIEVQVGVRTETVKARSAKEAVTKAAEVAEKK